MEQDNPNKQTTSASGNKRVGFNSNGSKASRSVRFGGVTSDENKLASKNNSLTEKRNENDKSDGSTSCDQVPRGRALQQTKPRGKRSQTPFARRRVNIYDSEDDGDDTGQAKSTVKAGESEHTKEETDEVASEEEVESNSKQNGTCASEESVSKLHNCSNVNANMPMEASRGRERFVNNRISRRSQTPFNRRLVNLDDTDDDGSSESIDGSVRNDKVLKIEPDAADRDGKGKLDDEIERRDFLAERVSFAKGDDGGIPNAHELSISADGNNTCGSSIPSKPMVYSTEEKHFTNNPLEARVLFDNEIKKDIASPLTPVEHFNGETEDLNKRSNKLRISFAEDVENICEKPKRITFTSEQKSSDAEIHKQSVSFTDNKKGRSPSKQRVSFAERDDRNDVNVDAQGRRKTTFMVTAFRSVSGRVQFAKTGTSTSESDGSDSDLNSASLETSDEDTVAQGLTKNGGGGLGTARGARRALSFTEVTKSDSNFPKAVLEPSRSKEFGREGSKTILSQRGSRGIRWAGQTDEGSSGKGPSTGSNEDVNETVVSKCVRFADHQSNVCSKTKSTERERGANASIGLHGRSGVTLRTEKKTSQVSFSSHHMDDGESKEKDEKRQSVGTRGSRGRNVETKNSEGKRKVVSFDTSALMLAKKGMYDENGLRKHGQTMPVAQMRGRGREEGMSGKRRSPTPFARRRVDIYTEDSEDEESSDEVMGRGEQMRASVKRAESPGRDEKSFKEDGKGTVSRGVSLLTVHTLGSDDEEEKWHRVDKGRKNKEEYDVCRTISKVTTIPSMDAEVERFDKATQTEMVVDGGGKWSVVKPFADVSVKPAKWMGGGPEWLGVTLVGVIRGVLGDCE